MASEAAEAEANKTCYNPLCNQSMDSVTKELQEAENRIKILKRQLVNAADNNGVSSVTFRQHHPNRGDTVQKYKKNVAEMETVL